MSQDIPVNHPVRRHFRKLLGHRRTTFRHDAPVGRRAADHEPMRGWIPAVVIAVVVACTDWIAKLLISRTVPLEQMYEVVPGRVAFWHVRNRAMVLGLWEDLPLGGRKAIAIVASLLGAAVLLQIVGRGHRFPRRHRAWAWVFVGLVLGGMMGNLGERVVHWGVTDYLSFRWGDVWLPPGNVADIALFLAIPLALPVIGFEIAGRARRGRARPRVAEPDAIGGVVAGD